MEPITYKNYLIISSHTRAKLRAMRITLDLCQIRMNVYDNRSLLVFKNYFAISFHVTDPIVIIILREYRRNPKV